MEDCRVSGRIKQNHTHTDGGVVISQGLFFMFLHHLQKTEEEGWRNEHK